MVKSLLVLNRELSGINEFMFRSLRELGWRVQAHGVGIPRMPQATLAAASFHPRRTLWKQRYHRALESYFASPKGMERRTAACARILRRDARAGDIVLAFGTLFVPRELAWQRPYAVFKDYTVALAARTHAVASSAASVRGDRPGVAPRDRGLERWMAYEADVCRSAAVVLVASENTKRSIVLDYGVAGERVAVVGEGLCFDSLPPHPAAALPDRGGILFVGKDFERKGGETLLAAFAQVRSRIPGARLTVIGPPPRRAAPSGVEWVGPVADRGRLARSFAEHAVFAMPSEREPFGLVFLEAMAHGLPCVATNRDAMPEIIEHEATGFLVEPGDVQMLADRLVFLLEHPEVGRAMGVRGYERVSRLFQWSHVARRIDAALVRLF